MSLRIRSSLGLLAVLAAAVVLALLYPSGASAADRGPSNLQASQDGSQVTLSWTPGTAEFARQVILRRQRGTGTGSRAGGDFVAASWVEVATLTAGARSYTDSDVADGERYSYRVRAERLGKEKLSKSVSIKVRETQSPPSGLTAAIQGENVVLSWTPGTHRAYTDQVVLRRQRGSGWERIHTTGTTSSTYTDPNTTPGEQYIYRIRGEKANGKGGLSNRVTVTAPESSGDGVN